jgi:excisionase family DNA binding protein
MSLNEYDALQCSSEETMKPNTSAPDSSRIPELLWDEADLAAAIGISTKRIQQLARRGLLPAFKLGRFWRFDPDAIRTWIKQASQTQKTPK